jgi:hypothetical protein
LHFLYIGNGSGAAVARIEQALRIQWNSILRTGEIASLSRRTTGALVDLSEHRQGGTEDIKHSNQSVS